MIFADKVFLNGKIDTQDDRWDQVDAFAIKGDKFLAVGSYQEIKGYISLDTEIIELKGKRVVPGFNDSHMHFLGYCLETSKVDLRGIKSISQLKLRLEDYNSKGQWVMGSGWNDTHFSEGRLPNRYDLDEIYPDRPVFLSRICYHICVVNSKALELAGIGVNTPDPAGGKIDKDPFTNEPTGILRENALNMVFHQLPKPSTKEEIKSLLSLGVERALKVGLTSIQSDDFESCLDYNNLISAYKELNSEGKMPIRFNLQVRANSKEDIIKYSNNGLYTRLGDHNVKIGPIKIMADGSLGSRTAAMEHPYNDKRESDGILIHSPEQMLELTKACKDTKFQMAVHAIGDRAMNVVLDAIEKVKPELRPRIIHCQITNDKIIDRFKELEVIADVQPSFVSSDYKIVEQRIGVDKAKDTYNWKTMLDKNIKVSGSSDSPIEDFNPILGIYGAVTRKDLDGNPEKGWLKDQCLTVKEAINIYTKGSAYSSFEEAIKGSISPGKLADFVVLSQDIYSIDGDNIKDVEIEQTYIGGELVYTQS